MSKNDFTPGEAPKKDGKWYEFEGVNDEGHFDLWVIRWERQQQPHPTSQGKWIYARCTRRDRVWSPGDIQPPARLQTAPWLLCKYDYTIYKRGERAPYRYHLNPEWQHGYGRIGSASNLTATEADEEERRILQRFPRLMSLEQAVAQAHTDGFDATGVENRRLHVRAQLLKHGRTPRNGEELMMWHSDPKDPAAAGQDVYIRWQFCGEERSEGVFTGLQANVRTGRLETKSLIGNHHLRYYRIQTKRERHGSGLKGQPLPWREVSDAKIIAVNYNVGMAPFMPGDLQPAFELPERRKVSTHTLRGGVLLQHLTETEKRKRKERDANNDGSRAKLEARAVRKRANSRNATAERKGKAPVASEQQIEQLAAAAAAAAAAKYKEREDEPPELLNAIGTRGDTNGNDHKVAGTTCIPDDASDPGMMVPDSKGTLVQGGERSRITGLNEPIRVAPRTAAKWGLMRREDVRLVPGVQIPGVVASGPNGTFTEDEWAAHSHNIVAVFFPTIPSLATESGVNSPFFGDDVTAWDLDCLNRPMCIAARGLTAANPLGTPPVWKAHNFCNSKYGVNGQEEALAKKLGTSTEGEVRGLNAPKNKVTGKGIAHLVSELRPAYEHWHKDVLEPYLQRLQIANEQPYYQELDRWVERDKQWLDEEQKRITQELQRQLQNADEEEEWEAPFGAPSADPLQPRPNPEAMPQPDPALDPGPKPVFDMMLKPGGDGGQALAMLAGISNSSCYSKVYWPELDFGKLYSDRSFVDIWRRMTNVRPPHLADAADGVQRPPAHIDACANEQLNSRHKNAFVLGVAFYYRPDFERACAQSEELATVAFLQQQAKQQLADNIALREKVAAKRDRAAGFERSQQRKMAAKQARDDAALALAQRQADEQERAQVLARDMQRIKAFHDEHLPTTLFPSLAHRGGACALHFTDQVLWNDYAEGHCEQPPSLHPSDTNAVGNGRDGFRFEEENDFNLRYQEWHQAKEDGAPHVPYKPCRGEPAFSVFAALVNADPELQQMNGLLMPFGSSDSGFAKRLAGDRNGPRFGEKPPDEVGALGRDIGQAERMWGYDKDNRSDYGKRVKDWEVAKSVAERHRLQGCAATALAAPSAFVSPQEKQKSAERAAARRAAKQAADLAKRKQQMQAALAARREARAAELHAAQQADDDAAALAAALSESDEWPEDAA